jgi:hypothetical protein
VTENDIAVPTQIESGVQKTEQFDNWVASTRARLAARRNGQPSTKIGAVRALWPEIKEALQGGQTLKTICDWLKDEGVSLQYNQLATYVWRIRRTPTITLARPAFEAHNLVAKLHPAALNAASAQARDPLANLRARPRTSRTFQYDPNFKEKDLL